MKIYLHMLKQWGHSMPGQTVAFDESKGRRVIKGGFAEEVPDPKIENAKAIAKVEAKAKAEAEAKAKVEADAEAEGKGKAETAMAEPAAENADARPNFGGHRKSKKKN